MRARAGGLSRPAGVAGDAQKAAGFRHARPARRDTSQRGCGDFNNLFDRRHAPAGSARYGLRMIALALAIGLVDFRQCGPARRARNLPRSPMSYRDASAGLVILTIRIPKFIKIQVSGPRTLLSMIDPAHLTLRLDLTGVGVGQVNPISRSVPTHVPGRATHRGHQRRAVADRARYRQKCRPPGTGPSWRSSTGSHPATKSHRPKSRPPRSRFAGPAAWSHASIESRREPLSVDGITGDLRTLVDLIAPSSTGRLETDEVTAKVTVTEAVATKEFRRIAINVRDSEFKFRLDPRQAGRWSCAVRG